MGKGLAIVGIVASVSAMLSILVFVGAAVFVAVAVILAGSIVLVAQRNVAAAVAAILVLALGVVATLGLAGSVTTKNGSTSFGISESTGRILVIAGCLAVPLAATGICWRNVQPAWYGYVGIAAGVVAFILAVMQAQTLPDSGNMLDLLAGVLALASGLPMVALLRESSGPAAA